MVLGIVVTLPLTLISSVVFVSLVIYVSIYLPQLTNSHDMRVLQILLEVSTEMTVNQLEILSPLLSIRHVNLSLIKGLKIIILSVVKCQLIDNSLINLV
jgi:hypothetical protein